MPDPVGKGTILIVEDNLVNQKVISAMLGKLDYAVDIVSDGRQAVAAVNNHEYDMVFMDCQMPVMDGYTATQEIRKGEEGAEGRLPIIAMTANAMMDDQGRCYAAGMDGFMSKPVMLDELQNIIDKWCPERESNPRPSP